jgi:formamidopyrimidine-DNA glycosylase
MPELPEVETVARHISPKLKGLEVSGARLLFSRLLREKSPDSLVKLKGRRVIGVRRRGKMLLIDFEGEMSLLFHFKMTGQFLFSSGSEPVDKHTHFILRFKDAARELRFRDTRKFGFISFLRSSDVLCSRELKDLGPEPFEISFSRFAGLFRGRKARLKSLLLNQNFLAGIGNIYSDEILFESKLHPLTRASSLDEDDLKRMFKAMRNVLRKAIRSRGTSVRDFVDCEGREGNYQNFLRVYGRESLPCFICGEKIIRIRLSGRSSFFCPGCQKRDVVSLCRLRK